MTPPPTKIARLALAMWGLMCMFAVSTEAVVIYSDDFNLDPGDAGSTGRVGFTSAWTETLGVADLGVMTITSDGSNARFGRTVSDSAAEEGEDFVRIAHTFSTVGFTDVTLRLTASQTSTEFEQNFDRLRIEYALDGSTFVILRTDWGFWNGSNDTSSSAISAGNTTPTATPILDLPDGADQNPLFTVRISGWYNAQPEAYILNSFTIEGAAIPEPSATVALLVGAMAFCLGRHRKLR